MVCAAQAAPIQAYPSECYPHFSPSATLTATGAQGDHQIVDIATFLVKESWKGNPAREVQVRADQPFEKSKEYVVFAGGTPFSTSIECRWTEPIERAKAKLDWLRKNRLASKPRASTSAPRSKTE